MHRTHAFVATVMSLGLTSLGLVGGCTWSPEQNINGGVTSGTAGHRNTGAGGVGVTFDGSPPSLDSNCGVTRNTGNRLPPDLLLVFDKSGSMLEDPTTGNNCNGGNCMSKWDLATAAVNTAVANTQATIRWGLKLFSNPGGGANNTCAVSTGVQVPIGLNTAGAIQAALAATGPAGSTPTTLAVNRGGDYLATLTTPNPRFIVLVTDGQPTCLAGGNAADDANAIAAVATQAARGFGTFVIGEANLGNSPADATLSMMSTNGLHPRVGTPNYYLVNNTAELVTALTLIGTQVSSCTFVLATSPPNPNNVRVEGDGVAIPANDVNGWVYEAGMKAVTLKGSYCDQVTAGTIKNVVVLFGCGMDPIP
jgi:hypothetical protein